MIVTIALMGSSLATASAGTPDPTPRIIGGQETARGDWPAVGALLSRAPGASAMLRQFCGATLIDTSHVLTAAHCVVNSDGSVLSGAQISVLFGATELDPTALEPGTGVGTEIGILNVFPHPEYVPESFYFDIAVLELELPATGIPIVGLQRVDPATLVGSPINVIGWGATGFDIYGEPIYGSRQMSTSVPIVSNEVCNSPSSYAGVIRDDQFCAGLEEGGVDACAGDSGGPAILGVDGRQVQIGIVSYGRGCARPNYYGVYTDVAAFEPFIRQYARPTFIRRSDDGLSDDVIVAAVDSGGGGGGGALQPLWLLAIAVSGIVARRRGIRLVLPATTI